MKNLMKILLPFLFIFAMSCQKEEQIVPNDSDDDVSLQENIIITFSSSGSGLKSEIVSHEGTISVYRDINSIMSAYKYPSMQPINVYWLIEWEDSYGSNLSYDIAGDEISFPFEYYATYKISISKKPGGEVIFSFFAQTSGLPGKWGDNEEYDNIIRGESVISPNGNRELLLLVKLDQEPTAPFKAYAAFEGMVREMSKYKLTNYYFIHIPAKDSPYYIRFMTTPSWGVDDNTWMSSYSHPIMGIRIHFPN